MADTGGFVCQGSSREGPPPVLLRVGAFGRLKYIHTSRAGGESSRLDYKETRTRKRGRPDDPASVDMPKKRRESTTRVAEIGIGLYQWMKHVGDQALEWRRGIG